MPNKELWGLNQKIDKNTPSDYKPKNVVDAFESRYVEYNSEKHKKFSVKRYLGKIRPNLKNPENVKCIWQWNQSTDSF